MKKDISLVIPVYNEEENIASLIIRLGELKKKMPGKNFEIIFVDDGSTDKSFDILKNLKAQNEDITIVRFKKNFGQTAAIAAGFKRASGSVTVTLDADLQNDPMDIPLLISEMEKGYDVISGWRKERKDPFFSKRLPSAIANALISRYTGVKLHDFGCTLKAYKTDLVKEINLYGELHRFIPALLSWYGASIMEIPVTHNPRKFGKSKYGILRTVNVILDLLTVKFLLVGSRGPMQIFGRMGLVCLFLGFLSAVSSIVMKFTYLYDITGNPVTYLAILFSVISVQFFSIGLLGEINMRIYSKSRGDEVYAVKEIIS